MGPLQVTQVVDLGGAGGASRDLESNYGGENSGSATVSPLAAHCTNKKRHSQLDANHLTEQNAGMVFCCCLSLLPTGAAMPRVLALRACVVLPTVQR